jgi:hypothetical protein
MQPKYCDEASPQAYCSRYSSPDAACYTGPSSILTGVGRDNEVFIDGFLLNDGSCAFEDNNYNLYYHSVGDFKQWIAENGSSMSTKVSFFTLLSAVLISLKAVL